MIKQCLHNLSFFGLIFLALFPEAEYAQNRSVTIKGSDTMVLLGQRWAELYMKKVPESRIQVTGGGSGTGIAALINGTTDICESSRPITQRERQAIRQKWGKDPVEIAVAIDGLAIYLHPSNSVDELSLSQLKGIYTGAVSNWKQVGGQDLRIVMYGRENNSGTYAFFKEHVLENQDFHPRTQTLPGTAAVVNAVSKDVKAIGYGGIAYSKGIKLVRVKSTDTGPSLIPSMENVLSGKYPVSRSLFWYFAGDPSGEAKSLTDWVLSPEGQAIVKEVGYYPLPRKGVVKNAGTSAPGGQQK
ncbi:MAG: phosphate ABC transporter substrate-binding protein [Acidobacteriota bacterium]